MSTTNGGHANQVMGILSALGYRVSLQAQEDGYWVAWAKYGNEGHVFFARAATPVGAAETLIAQMQEDIARVTAETNEATDVQIEMPQPEVVAGDPVLEDVQSLRESTAKLAMDLKQLVDGIAKDQQERDEDRAIR